MARVKWASPDARDPEKELNILMNNIRTKQTHRKLTLLTKGPRSELDYIQVPT